MYRFIHILKNLRLLIIRNTPRLAAWIFILVALIPQWATAGMATLSNRPATADFINKMVAKYNFDPGQLAQLFNQVQLRPDILKSFKTPKEGSPWYVYRNFFMTDQRIQQGIQFWNKHPRALALAKQKYGIPPQIIVAIIGVETQYGQYTGKYRVIDTLSTLAFLDNSRQSFFQKELEQFLLLSREQNFNPLAIKGSYAGAIGLPQFMPSSYRNYAVSINNKDQPDLLENADDAILSVGNYFHKYGWKTGQIITIPATVKGSKYGQYVNKGLKPRYKVADLMAAGVKPSQKISKANQAALFQLQQANNYEYWLGFNNFYVITGYNPSLQYAMAVYQLAHKMNVQRTVELSLSNKKRTNNKIVTKDVTPTKASIQS